MGTREGVAAKIDAETKVKIEEMNKLVKAQQDLVSFIESQLYYVYFLFINSKAGRKHCVNRLHIVTMSE